MIIARVELTEEFAQWFRRSYIIMKFIGGKTEMNEWKDNPDNKRYITGVTVIEEKK